MNVEKTVANLWVLGIRKLNNCNIHLDASKFQPYCANTDHSRRLNRLFLLNYAQVLYIMEKHMEKLPLEVEAHDEREAAPSTPMMFKKATKKPNRCSKKKKGKCESFSAQLHS